MPHRPDDGCPCRKPRLGLYQRAIADLGLDATVSVVIGDTMSDLLAARALGCRAGLVRTGWASWSIEHEGADRIADAVVADILQAARWVEELSAPAR